MMYSNDFESVIRLKVAGMNAPSQGTQVYQKKKVYDTNWSADDYYYLG